jgi:hypothetical protein
MKGSGAAIAKREKASGRYGALGWISWDLRGVIIQLTEAVKLWGVIEHSPVVVPAESTVG